MNLHEKYEYISFDTLKTLPKFPKGKIIPYCMACKQGKETKPLAQNQSQNRIRAGKPLEQLHAYIVEIKPIIFRTKYQYLLIVVDNYSCYTITKPLKETSDAFNTLVEIINQLKDVCSPSRVYKIQANCGEFRNNTFKEEIKQKEYQLTQTVLYHSEIHMIIKQTNHTIITITQTAIIETNKKLIKSVWDRESGWSRCTKNQIAHKTLKEKNPIEKLFPHKSITHEQADLGPFQ